MMEVRIDRYDPDTQNSRVERFEIPQEICEGMTVMDVLGYIATQYDPTLAYYQHSVCNHGICGRCSLRVNGKVRLACITPVEGLTELHVAPADGRTVIRDLVTRL